MNCFQLQKEIEAYGRNKASHGLVRDAMCFLKTKLFLHSFSLIIYRLNIPAIFRLSDLSYEIFFPNQLEGRIKLVVWILN